VFSSKLFKVAIKQSRVTFEEYFFVKLTEVMLQPLSYNLKEKSKTYLNF